MLLAPQQGDIACTWTAGNCPTAIPTWRPTTRGRVVDGGARQPVLTRPVASPDPGRRPRRNRRALQQLARRRSMTIPGTAPSRSGKSLPHAGNARRRALLERRRGHRVRCVRESVGSPSGKGRPAGRAAAWISNCDLAVWVDGLVACRFPRMRSTRNKSQRMLWAPACLGHAQSPLLILG
jgi:hypothetical protein